MFAIQLGTKSIKDEGKKQEDRGETSGGEKRRGRLDSCEKLALLQMTHFHTPASLSLSLIYENLSHTAPWCLHMQNQFLK